MISFLESGLSISATGNQDGHLIIFDHFGEKIGWYFANPFVWVILLGTVAFLLLYYGVYAYYSRLKNIHTDLRVVRPPLDMSATAMRYLWKKGFDTKITVIALVNAALHGCYRIKWMQESFLAEKNVGADFNLISGTDRPALAFAKDNYWDKVHVSKMPNGVTRRVGERLDKSLSGTYRKYIRRNIGLLLGGIFLSVFAAAAIFSQSPNPDMINYFWMYMGAFSIGIILPMIFLIQVIRDKYWFGITFSLIFMAAGLIALIHIELRPDSQFYSLAVIPLALVNILFARKLSTHTPTGKKIMNHVSAYKNYLTEKFDKVANGEIPFREIVHELPYALALDLDYSFTRYFEPMLEQKKYEPYQIFDEIYGR